MSNEIKMPSVGESITSATISEWLKNDGDYVTKDDDILSFETDKVSQGLPAGFDGILKYQVSEGDEVDIGAVVALIEEGEAPAGSDTATGSADGGSEKSEAPAPAASTSGNDDVKATPVAKKIAEDKGIDLSSVTGTGTNGKITKEDVLAIAEGASVAKLAASTPAASSAPATTEAPRVGRTSRHKMSPLRRKIADHLVSAQQNAAILTTFNEVDMTNIMALRKRVQDSFVSKHGTKLGFMSFFIKAVVEGLQAVPSINGQIEDGEIIQNHFYDIGVAVGTEKGLMVPVIRDCEEKSFAEIEQSIIDYAGKARDGKIQLSDLQGGVFTISNGGVYGSLLSTPILNPPQSGILGMHTIQQRPVAIDGEVVIRPMMYLALSYDHRLVDGKEAVTFLIRVKECLEDPERLAVGV
ncbi:2-oxoglutarate dehydrogenase complex dihydrolipoyllysine-residue succinyltransferase [Verrucomicrobiales bacterium]|nr:2-oxoglutarate dehydrogenase complex dihydrolipoyllysine-residue succinyltransferase [Verrucomicrobiales bacterium]